MLKSEFGRKLFAREQYENTFDSDSEALGCNPSQTTCISCAENTRVQSFPCISFYTSIRTSVTAYESLLLAVNIKSRNQGLRIEKNKVEWRFFMVKTRERVEKAKGGQPGLTATF